MSKLQWIQLSQGQRHGIEPMFPVSRASPALAVGLFTSAPPGFPRREGSQPVRLCNRSRSWKSCQLKTVFRPYSSCLDIKSFLEEWSGKKKKKSDLGLHLLTHLTTAFRTQRHQEPKQFGSCLPLFHLLLLKMCFRYTSHLLFFKLFNTIFRGYFPFKLFNLPVCWSLSPPQGFCVSYSSCLKCHTCLSYLLLMLPVTILVTS